MMRPRLLFIFGTRPEALKLAPLILKSYSLKHEVITRVCFTGQHRLMADQVLNLFDIKPDYDLNVMRPGQSLGDLTHRLLNAVQRVIRDVRPHCIIVQGDTTSAFVVALQSFYDRIPVAHIEAGLRSRNKNHPFPEEINRILLSHLADYHFAPTTEAKNNLLSEGFHPKSVFVTGNTIVDALSWVRKHMKDSKTKLQIPIAPKKKIILVTAHRRESFGAPFRNICMALCDIAKANPDVEIIYPVHLNPQVRKHVFKILAHKKGIQLLPPLAYQEFVCLMEHCYLILTDSGGIQEEAPSFKKPVLVMRQVSERPDGIRLGVAKLVGTSRKTIAVECTKLLRNQSLYQTMIKKGNPYGDGKASDRILNILLKELRRG